MLQAVITIEGGTEERTEDLEASSLCLWLTHSAMKADDRQAGI